jgi:hypothetical protein
MLCLMTYAAYPVTASVAGGLYLAEYIWPVIILIAALYKCKVEALPQQSISSSLNRLPAGATHLF